MKSLALPSAWASNRLDRRLAQSSLYLPDAVNEASRRAVFEERLFRKYENAGFNSNRGPLMRLFRFVIFVVLLELSFFVAKQFLEHPTPLQIGTVFEHFPIVLNVLLDDRPLHISLRMPQCPR